MGNLSISVRDFQSISKADIDLEDGINIIVGKTNGGKSAIIRAIDTAIFNMGNDEFVKTGKRYSAVKITSEPNTFIMRRDTHGKNEKSMYQINNDSPMTKVGRGQLEEISKLFNITEVRMNNNIKVKINFWFQGDSPFLTDKSQGQLFEFLSMSSCDKYQKVLKKMRVDIKDYSTKIKSLNASIDTIKQLNIEKKDYIDKNSGFVDLYTKIAKINHDIAQFNTVEDMVTRIGELQARISIKLNHLNTTIESISNLNFDAMKVMYEDTIKTNNYVSEVFDVLTQIKKKGGNRNKLVDMVKRITPKFIELSDGANTVSKTIKTLEVNTQSLNEMGTCIKNISAKKERKSSVDKGLSNIKLSMNKIDVEQVRGEVGELEKKILILHDIESVLIPLNTLSFNLSSKKDILKDAQKEWEKKEKELLIFKNDIGMCPYCNNSFT
jgi:DNA repair ATPase RecN